VNTETPGWAPAGDWPQPPPAPERRKRGRIGLVIGAVVLVSVGALVAFVALNRSARETIDAFAHGANKVYVLRASSMEPTLRPGDRVASKSHYGTIAHGDVVVVKSSAPGVKVEVKRVVALPGDTISTIADAVWLNGAKLDEPYARGPTIGLTATKVPPGSYYLLGDNRLESRDSRVYGPVPKEDVVGVVIRIIAPSSHAGRIAGSHR
jgi:signal peptidase I